jgi:hypothetical protein
VSYCDPEQRLSFVPSGDAVARVVGGFCFGGRDAPEADIDQVDALALSIGRRRGRKARNPQTAVSSNRHRSTVLVRGRTTSDLSTRREERSDADTDLMRPRHPPKYAERARTRAQLIRASTWRGRAVGLSTERHLAHVAGPAFGLQNDLSHGLCLHLATLRGNDDSAPPRTNLIPGGRRGEFTALTHRATGVTWCPHVAEGTPRHGSHASKRSRRGPTSPSARSY